MRVYPENIDLEKAKRVSEQSSIPLKNVLEGMALGAQFMTEEEFNLKTLSLERLAQFSFEEVVKNSPDPKILEYCQSDAAKTYAVYRALMDVELKWYHRLWQTIKRFWRRLWK